MKKQISTLNLQCEEEKRRKHAAHGKPSWFIEKHGVAQLLFLGFTKSGKSSLISAVTNAKPLVSDFPFSTSAPAAGMLPYQDISFQLVDAPSFQPTLEDSSWNAKVLSLARNSDGLILTINLQDEPVEQLEFLKEILGTARIMVEKPKSRVVVDRRNVASGIQTVGRLINSTSEEVKQLLNSYKVYNAVVKIYGEATLDDVEEAIFEGTLYKPTIILANKFDLGDAPENLSRLRAASGTLRVYPVSCKTREGLDGLGFELFKAVELLRVYTKHPSCKEASPEPIVLRKGATVLDVGKEIHTSFYRNLDFVKIWGSTASYPGEKFGGDHVLADGDVLEFHLK